MNKTDFRKREIKLSEIELNKLFFKEEKIRFFDNVNHKKPFSKKEK